MTYTGTSGLDADDLILTESLLSDRRAWDDVSAVHRLEQEFCQWNASGAAFAFVSARVALGAAVAALGLNPGDQVVVPGTPASSSPTSGSVTV